MNSFKSKFPNQPITIFTQMSRLASECGAINLSQGFPDFDVSPELLELTNRQLKSAKNQYAPMAGVMELREELSLLQREFYQAEYNPETEITVVAGATQGVFTAISAFVHEGDEVIMFSPAYDCYEPAVRLNKGKSVFVSLKSEDYSIPWEEVEEKITAKTRVILLNSPHNPSGAVVTKEDMLKLQELAVKHDLIVISDEVYAHIIFDGNDHESAAKYPELKQRTVVVHSFGKTFHVTGWKLGYVLAPEPLMAEFRKIHQYVVFCVNTPMQYALSEYIKNRENVRSLSAFYQAKRDLFLDGIKDSRFKFTPAKGSYFQLLDYSEITDLGDVELAKKWTRELGLASIPISVFFPDKRDDKVLRFCFAKRTEIIEKATEILCKI